MDVRTSIAAQNYAKARTAAAPSPGTGGDSFAQLAGSFADILKQSESVSRAAMTGGADPHALVQALAQSQLAVETVTAVRDKVVEAYQEILRMPV
jgi:flagellar hook-basal body complex protein FliE